MSIDTKTALLNSAERAARRFGFDGFSYADLSQDVGIRKASIHHHFPTKAALCTALVQRYHATFADACQQIDEAHASGGARLRALISRYRDALNDGHTLCLCVALSPSRDSLPPEVIQRIGQFRAGVLAWMATAFERGQADGSIAGVNDPKAEAMATLPLLEGAQLAARAAGHPDRYDAAVQIMLARLS